MITVGATTIGKTLGRVQAFNLYKGGRVSINRVAGRVDENRPTIADAINELWGTAL